MLHQMGAHTAAQLLTWTGFGEATRQTADFQPTFPPVVVNSPCLHWPSASLPADGKLLLVV